MAMAAENKQIEVEEKPKPQVREWEATISRKAWGDFVGCVSTQVDACRLMLDRTGIYVKEVDPAHVAMVETRLFATAFESYRIKGSGEIGIDLDKMKEMLKVTKKKDAAIHLKLDAPKNRLIMELNGNQRSMGLVDTAGMLEPRVPRLTHPATVVVNAQELFTAVKQCGSVCDHAELTATPKVFRVLAEGEDSFKREFSVDELAVLVAEENVTSLFHLDYLTRLTKEATCFHEVALGLGNNSPLSMRGCRAGVMDALFLLAPKVEYD